MRFLHPSDDGRFVELSAEMGTVRLRINPDGVSVNDDKFLPWQQGPVQGRTTAKMTMSIGGEPVAWTDWARSMAAGGVPPAPAPADTTGRCPVCGLSPQAAGCSPEKCGSESSLDSIKRAHDARRPNWEDVMPARCPVCGLHPETRGCEKGRCRGGEPFRAVSLSDWRAETRAHVGTGGTRGETYRLVSARPGPGDQLAPEHVNAGEPTYSVVTDPIEFRGDPAAWAAFAAALENGPGAPALCPSCAVRRDSSKAAGMFGYVICAACSEVWDAAHPAPALDHPPPWRWAEGDWPLLGHEEKDRTNCPAALVDANGAEVLSAGLWFDEGTNCVFVDSAYVRELTALSPEMDIALRKVRVACQVDCGGAGCTCGCACHVVAALVARLDAARKAGRDG